MLPSEKIQKVLQDLPDSYQAEVLDFVEYLKAKADVGVFNQECRDWSNFSLYSAMREMKHDELPTCSPSHPRVEDQKSVGSYEKIAGDVLSLPADLRMILIEKLLVSLNLPIQADIDRLWGEEAERRVAQIAEGEVEPISGEEVFAKLREQYKR